MADLVELQRKADEANGNYGRGMAQWERGEISRAELGVLKRRAMRAELALYTGRAPAEVPVSA